MKQSKNQEVTEKKTNSPPDKKYNSQKVEGQRVEELMSQGLLESTFIYSKNHRAYKSKIRKKSVTFGLVSKRLLKKRVIGSA